MKDINQVFEQSKNVFFAADIGKNFIQTKEDQPVEQYLKNAKELISKAKEAGADAVKFQTHWVEDEQLDLQVTSPHFSAQDRYAWVKRNSDIGSKDFWIELKEYCHQLEITFFSTPMSRGAAKVLEEIGVPFWKVGSGDILDFVLLDFLASTKKPVILASGMSTLEEVDRSVEFLKKRGCPTLLLYCVSKYPCPIEDLKLGTINFFQNRYNIPVGFSDHSLGFEADLIAVQRGAVVIEKHFSLSRELWGSDHKVSMTPDEYRRMVDEIRKGGVKEVLLDGTDRVSPADDELVFRPIFRKALRFSEDLKAGQEIRKEHIYAMRPQGFIKGLPSENYEQVLGKRLKRNVNKFDPITWEILN